VTPPVARSRWPSALAGAVAGTLLTLFVLALGVRAGWGDRLVRDALRRNPQILVETADALRDRQYAPVLAANRAAIETPWGSSWQGSRAPDVTLVEYYDYACGYCRASLPILARLIAEDPKLRIVYREFPILGPGSDAAARLALEASKAGRFAAFHDSLYAAGRPDPQTLAIAARAAEIPFAPSQDPAIDAEIKANYRIAGQLGASGTPLFVVGNRVMNGAVGYDALKAAIAAARERAD
jgi:protein-disulfide isomerase